MIKQIYKNNLVINYRDQGKGPVIMLVHGFLETLEIWNNFDNELAESFRVISVDLPGHGLSDLYKEPFTMCKYAESLKEVLAAENIQKVFLIGHSMGGYVSLAFSENYPKLLSGLCLFHSSPYPDNIEKQKLRLQTIDTIKKGILKDLCYSHVRSVYADNNVNRFNNQIDSAKKIALSIDPESVIASILTMKDRNDRSDVLKKLESPFLFVIGKKDNFISLDILQQIEMPKESKTIILENSGHMGMVEQKEESVRGIINFYEEFIKE